MEELAFVFLSIKLFPPPFDFIFKFLLLLVFIDGLLSESYNGSSKTLDLSQLLAALLTFFIQVFDVFPELGFLLLYVDIVGLHVLVFLLF